MLARAQAACQLTSSPLKEIPLLLILCGFVIFFKFAERKPSTKSTGGIAEPCSTNHDRNRLNSSTRNSRFPAIAPSV